MIHIEQLLSSNNVVDIAKQLVGVEIYTRFNNQTTAGIITETEAYAGETDKASHAYGGRRTPRTETMYRSAGTAYIYLCYGMHHLFNIVTGPKDTPHAVLLRGIEPTHGEEIMRDRMNKPTGKLRLDGPGKAAKALGITTAANGSSIDGSLIGLKLPSFDIGRLDILVGPRIGVDYAGQDALLPYRFYIQKNSFLAVP
jgi:DNA-3-methyladenine glycosylase